MEDEDIAIFSLHPYPYNIWDIHTQRIISYLSEVQM